MRHGKRRQKLTRTSSHHRCLMANMLKSLITKGRIETTVAKAKVMRSYADKMITLAKKGSLDARRRAVAKLMVRYNSLNAEQARRARSGDTSVCNDDRKVIDILFNELASRFTNRDGGYTRIVRSGNRVGDNAETCILEYLPE